MNVVDPQFTDLETRRNLRRQDLLSSIWHPPMDFSVEEPELLFNNHEESYDETIKHYFDIDFWFKLMLLAYAASQFERLIFFVGDQDTPSAMNIFLAIVVIGGGFQMLVIKSKSSYELQQKLGQLERNMMEYFKAKMDYQEGIINAQTAKVDAQTAKVDAQTGIINAQTASIKTDMENQTREIKKMLDMNKSWF